MREREDELVDDLVVADRPRDRRDLDVLRPLADEVPVRRSWRTSSTPTPPVITGTWLTYGSSVIVAIVASRSRSTNSAATCSSKTAPMSGRLAGFPCRCGTYRIATSLDMSRRRVTESRHAPARGRVRTPGHGRGGDLGARDVRRRAAARRRADARERHEGARGGAGRARRPRRSRRAARRSASPRTGCSRSARWSRTRSSWAPRRSRSRGRSWPRSRRRSPTSRCATAARSAATSA